MAAMLAGDSSQQRLFTPYLTHILSQLRHIVFLKIYTSVLVSV